MKVDRATSMMLFGNRRIFTGELLPAEWKYSFKAIGYDARHAVSVRSPFIPS
jgi:hypothetical protein